MELNTRNVTSYIGVGVGVAVVLKTLGWLLGQFETTVSVGA